MSKRCEAGAQMRWRPGAFCRVSPGDSDILSSCDMKDDLAFTTLQRNPAFFRVRASQGPFHLNQKTEGPSHIHISDGKLRLRCLWKVGLSLKSKTGNHLSSHDDMVCKELSSICFIEIAVPVDMRWLSHGISGFS